jgi:hypothetical protein
MAAQIPAQEFGHDDDSSHQFGWADRWEEFTTRREESRSPAARGHAATHDFFVVCRFGSST